MIKVNVPALLLLLILSVPLSDQRGLLNSRRLQGRHSRAASSNVGIGAPLSKEEFELSLYQTSDENSDNASDGWAQLTTGLVEGDIAGLEAGSSADKFHNAINLEERLWKDGIVPYTISDAFKQDERITIARGMRSIMDKSCIEFVPRTTEVDYVHIMNGKGCYSEIGRAGGKQDLSLKKGSCTSVETTIHELLHALGFAHEHNRPDRDKYIRINEDNLEDGALEQFKIYDSLQYHNWTDYDINSIMHYKAYYFAKDKNIPTIKPVRKSSTGVGTIDGKLSQLDILKLNKLYNCDYSLAIGCPVEYLGNPNNKCFKIQRYGCYCIVKERKNRAEADQFCRDNKMQLAWLETKEEEKKLNELMVENEMSGFWTSGELMQLNGEWRWGQVTPSTSFPVTDFNWCAKSPDNYDGEEFYVLVRNHLGGIVCWEDAPGDSIWPAICKPPLTTKMLLDNMKIYSQAIMKLNSQLNVAFNEIQDLKKKLG